MKSDAMSKVSLLVNLQQPLTLLTIHKKARSRSINTDFAPSKPKIVDEFWGEDTLQKGQSLCTDRVGDQLK